MSYGETIQTYWREVTKLGASYSYEAEKWSLNAGATYLDASHSFKEYPVVYSQSLSYAEPWAAFSCTFIPAPSWGIKLTPSAAYKISLGGEKLSEQSYGNLTVLDSNRILMAPLDAEYSYWSADVWTGSLRAEGWHQLDGGKKVSLGIGCSLARAVQSGASRSTVVLSLGYNF